MPCWPALPSCPWPALPSLPLPRTLPRCLPLSCCSENPDYHLLTDANLTYSVRYNGSAMAGAPPPQQPQHQQHQQQQYGAPHHQHQHHLGNAGGMGGGGMGGMGGSAPHMLHMVGGGLPMQRNGGGGGNGGNGAAAGNGASVTIALPEDKVGVVIGKQVGGAGA